MDFDKLKTRLSSFWVLNAAGWLAIAGFAAISTYRGPWTDVGRFLPFFFPYMSGFLISIPLRYFYKKIRLQERPLNFVLLVALASAFFAANLWLGADVLISLFIPHPLEPSRSFVQAYANSMLNSGSILVGWTALYFGIKARREWEQQKQRTQKANALAQTAQLQMLRYQLNPHFLFNSMNSIRALIDEDETKARELITELSEFLRYSLDSKDFANVPLRHEIEAIRHYFAIQKKRYEDKLEVVYDVEPEAGEFPVLSFLVHPLVENAVKYGMRTSPLPLVVQLKAKIRDGTLVIEVSNTGKWIEPQVQKGQPSAGTGTGLENVRLRLENAFPKGHNFEIVEREGRVHIKLEIQKLPGNDREKSL
jgi:LytS/YehU family sensor histidine kinase